jgi:hypothetical protein
LILISGLNDGIVEPIWDKILLTMRAFPFLFLNDAFVTVAHKISRTFVHFIWLKVEGAEHAETGCANDIDLKIMILGIESKQRFADSTFL